MQEGAYLYDLSADAPLPMRRTETITRVVPLETDDRIVLSARTTFTRGTWCKRERSSLQDKGRF